MSDGVSIPADKQVLNDERVFAVGFADMLCLVARLPDYVTRNLPSSDIISCAPGSRRELWCKEDSI